MKYAFDAQGAQELDAGDGLASCRSHFVVDDPDLIYLDGNSLGRLPVKASSVVRETVEREWGGRLIRGWNDGWIGSPVELGAKLARLIGAETDEVVVADSTTINLFKLAAAALGARRERRRVVSDVLNFPSDLYVLQGLIRLLDRGHELVLAPSGDGITVRHQELEGAVDDDTALVCLSHVSFKSGFLYDMAAVTRLVHGHGALALWDLSHSVGAVPIDLNSSGADLAVGCTYKYLNAGPGAPAFLYVRRDLQEELCSPIWGWLGAAQPFAFDLDYTPAGGVGRFWVGTPPILSLSPLAPALDLLGEVGIDRLRAKSVMQTEYLVELADQRLLPLGFSLGSPRQAELRGSHVALRHREAYRINRALIEPLTDAPRVIPDFRHPDSLRLGVAPLYTTFTDIYRGVERLAEVATSREYERHSSERAAVT